MKIIWLLIEVNFYFSGDKEIFLFFAEIAQGRISTKKPNKILWTPGLKKHFLNFSVAWNAPLLKYQKSTSGIFYFNFTSSSISRGKKMPEQINLGGELPLFIKATIQGYFLRNHKHLKFYLKLT